MNTDRLPALETNDSERIQNPREADLVQLVVEALCQSGVAEKTIGVLSVYRAQLRLLTARLRGRTGVEVLTADRSQGRDKDCILISLVRSNVHAAVGELLRDWRRLNVSFTRAKSKLVIVGSRCTLESIGVLRAFLELVDERGWAYELPPDADTIYQGLKPTDLLETPTKLGSKVSSQLHKIKSPVQPTQARRVGGISRPATRRLGVVHDLIGEFPQQPRR